MKHTFSLIVLILLFCSGSLFGQGGPLPRSTPEKEGVSSEGILRYIDAVEKGKQNLHSIMVVRHGKVVAEGWWEENHPELNHPLHSVAKTFTSTAVGFAVKEKLLSVDDKVIKFFPEHLPDTISPYLASLTVKNLLTMTVGHNPEPGWMIEDWISSFLATPIIDEPGTKFLYSSLASFMLSAIIQKVSGQKLTDYLQPRLFEPLGIKNVIWEDDPTGNITNGSGSMYAKTEDLAKLGQFYLQKGKWDGKQLLPMSWMEEATTKKIEQNPEWTNQQKSESDWAQGYCYQIWRGRHNTYWAGGAFGQYIIIMPDQDAVIVMTAHYLHMQTQLNTVWDYLLPAIHEKPLPADPANEKALKEKLAWLRFTICN